MTDKNEISPIGGQVLKWALCWVLVVVLAYALGVATGASEALLEGTDRSPGRVLRAAAALLVAASCVLAVARLKPWKSPGEPIAPGTRKARNLLLISGAVGGVLGLVLAISTINMDEPWALFTDSPMPRAVVIPTIAVWLLIVPLISWQWHRSIDEHEVGAYSFGGLAALYLYAFLAPAWWLAWRGGLVPEPETMVIYLIVMIVWCIGWFWRRYR